MKSKIQVVPCIDVMGGKVVQLVRGEKKALELEPDEAVTMFEGFPLLHIIDLDAALGRGENGELVKWLLTKVNARVGGGVRTAERARDLLELGAAQVIVGTRAFTSDAVDTDFLGTLDPGKTIVAIDVKGGRVAVKGWTDTIDATPKEVIQQLEPYCAGFLCTCVDREGMLEGTDLDLFLNLRQMTTRTLVAAGGITTMQEVRVLVDAGIQVALGMSVYTGRLSLEQLRELA